MSTIKIQSDGSVKLGVFDTANMMLDSMKDLDPQQQTIITLEGLTKSKAHAVSQLLLAGITFTMGPLEKIAVTRSESKDETTIILPPKQSFPAHSIRALIGGFRQNITNDRAPKAIIEGIGYRVFPSSTRTQMDVVLPMLSAISASSGNVDTDISTVYDGLKLGDGNTYPCIVMKETAFQKLVSAEKQRTP